MSKLHPMTSLVIGFLLLVTLGRHLGQYMFLDGYTHATIALNYILYDRTFWTPIFAIEGPTYLNQVHLPLALWLQSRYFMVAGWSNAAIMWWGLIWSGLTSLVLIQIWRRVFHHYEKDLNVGGWWPMLILFLIPLTSWGVANNILEVPLSFFSTLAYALCFLANLHLNKSDSIGKSLKVVLSLGLASGVAIFLAFLCKGSPALFPLAAPFLISPIIQKQRRSWRVAIGWSGLLFLAILAGTTASWVASKAIWGQEMADYLDYNFNLQVGSEFQCIRSGFQVCQFYILRRLAEEMILPVLVVGVLGVCYRKGSGGIGSLFLGIIFLGIALSASLPFVFGEKQFERYLYPSLPFYSLSLAAFTGGIANRLSIHLASHKRATFRIHCLGGLLGLIGLLLFIGFPGRIVERNHDFHHDIVEEGIVFPSTAIVKVCSREDLNDWVLINLMRLRFGIHLTSGTAAQYVLVNEQSGTCQVPRNCVSLTKGQPRVYRVYQCP